MQSCLTNEDQSLLCLVTDPFFNFVQLFPWQNPDESYQQNTYAQKSGVMGTLGQTQFPVSHLH